MTGECLDDMREQKVFGWVIDSAGGRVTSYTPGSEKKITTTSQRASPSPSENNIAWFTSCAK